MNISMSNHQNGYLSTPALLCGMLIVGTFGTIIGADYFESSVNAYFFPKAEYEEYMELIKKINPTIYARMKKGEAQIGIPLLKGARNISGTVHTSEATRGYPTIYIKSLKNYAEQDKINLLTTPIDDYRDKEIVPAITKQEQKLVMDTIKFLAPDLYRAIVEIDFTGRHHVKRDFDFSGASVIASELDGLPIMLVDPDETKLPLKEFRFSIAHELGHYVLQHSGVMQHATEFSAIHPVLAQQGKSEEFTPGKKVSGQLPFAESFHFAYTRVQEYEADRFAVMELGIPIDDAIASAQSELQEVGEHELENPHKETFKETHPLWKARIEQLESLRREVELNKAQSKLIDWRALAAEYMQEYSKKTKVIQ